MLAVSGGGHLSTDFSSMQCLWLRLLCVEFALQPQHETSLDSGIQLIKDFNYFKSKSRKRPRSLSLVLLNSND